jgi:hypothetical protein
MGRKKKISGGGILDSNTSGESIQSIVIIILIFLMGFLLAWMYFSENKKQNVVIVQKEKTVKNIVEKEENPLAPVYPHMKPKYPLQHTQQDYQQLGMLVSKDIAEVTPVLLPLFGRKLYSRDRWEYYTASPEYHMWKLPVMVKNRDCQDDVGCDEIYNGDDVTVPDYANKVFTARIYKYREQSVFSEPY